MAQRFEHPADFDFEHYTASSFGVIAEPATAVRIRFDKRWAAYVEEHTWHASQKLETLPDGQVELRMEVGGTAELRTWILSFGSGAEVLEPAALRDEVVSELRDSLARYAPGAAPRKRKAARGRKTAR